MKSNEEYVFKLWNGGYMFAPSQIVRVNFNNDGNSMIGVIEELIFTQADGGPTPLAKVFFFPWWENGQRGGYIEGTFVPHRYCKNVNSLTKGEYDALNLFEEDNLFYINKNKEKIFPFKLLKQNKE